MHISLQILYPEKMYMDHLLKAYFYFYIFVFRKFICLNDNIDHTQDQAKTVSKLL